MGIRDWLFGPQTKASVFALGDMGLPDVPLEKRLDDELVLSTYADDAWPYIFATKIAEQAAQAPLRIGLPGEDDTFEFAPPDSPWQRLLDDPNPQQDGGELVHLLMLYLELVGHAPIEVVRTTGRRAGQVWVHNPAPWRIVSDADRSIRGYLYRIEGKDVPLTPEQMTYVRWPNPNDPWYGQGRIAAARQQVMAEEYATIRDRNFEKRLGVPPGVLSSEMPIGDPQARELQKRWEQAVGGYQNAGKIAVLGSKTTYTPISLNARDSEWLAQRQWRVETLAAAFGVPLPMVRMQDATFSNLEGARAEFWEGTLQPRMERVARMLTSKLLPLLGAPAGYQLRFDYSRVDALGENQLEAANTAKVWADTGVVTVDEVRKRMGLPEHPDKAIGSRLLKPSSVELVSTEDILAPPEPPPTAPPPGAPEPEEEEEPETRSARPAIRKADPPRPDRDRMLAPIADGYRRDLAGFFVAQLGAIVGAIGKVTRAAKADPLPDDALDAAEAAVMARRFTERLARISETPIRASFVLGSEGAAAKLGIEAAFDLAASPEAVRFLTAHLERLGIGIQNTTLADVRGVLTEALREQWDIAETRAALARLFDDYADWRLDRIARTETAAAYNIGSIHQYREAGFTQVLVTDGTGDEVCAAANGKVWTLEMALDDPLGHPNCTRDWEVVTDDEFGNPIGLAATPATSKDAERHAELMSALVAVATRVHEAPVVNVTIAEGAVAVPVTVEAPAVNVTPAPVTVTLAQPGPTRKTVRRDDRGNVVEIIEAPADDAVIERG